MTDITADSSMECEKENTQWTKSNKLLRQADSLIIKPTSEEVLFRSLNKSSNAPVRWSDTELVCTKCDRDLKSLICEGRIVPEHPLLKVLYCQPCCDYYGNGEFSLDEDEEDKYCRWCGRGGKLFLCSKCICGFCASCIKKHFGNDVLTAVKNDDDWMCFFCEPKPLWRLRQICSYAIEKSLNERKDNEKKSLDDQNVEAIAEPSCSAIHDQALKGNNHFN